MRELSTSDITQFIESGYLKIEHAFSADIIGACTEILWKYSGCAPDNPATWKKPVVRIGELTESPFVLAANTPVLLRAYDHLTHGNWIPKKSLGTFPLRFPSDEAANDTGWHVDASFPGEDPANYLEWRINIHSRGRALLMLFLFTDVEKHDAPTRIKTGSHQNVAKILSSEGKRGLSFMELASRLDELQYGTEVEATGPAGTVYLCHPFLVHSAQQHTGTRPKFMAQPSLASFHDFDIQKPEDQLCPVEKGILAAVKQPR